MIIENELSKSPEFFQGLPQTELAYWLGFVCGGAQVSPSRSRIISNNSNPHKRSILKTVSQDVFGSAINYKQASSTIMYVANRSLLESVGDLTRFHWADTVKETHRWILENQSNKKWFIAGYFDTNGTLRERDRCLELSTPSENGANLLLLMMGDIGIPPLKIHSSTDKNSGIGGIRTYSIGTIQKFSRKIHSLNPIQEEKLHKCRGNIIKVPNHTGRIMFEFQSPDKDTQRVTTITSNWIVLLEAGVPWTTIEGTVEALENPQISEEYKQSLFTTFQAHTEYVRGIMLK